ncbi:HlyC/CorC family transporter [Legionella taurinensis]|uniref:HlyC/CorC family transporter n=1 Tax=Legionella taurinensis TaxID=70611 RepID=A0A3A5L283_9GAMM|nr:HlyC/CorC family transporter [Legionella taurinensis]MDX1838517.1 HlyC/CorC family transporter [Legionella taurinensis]PUT38959.1 magnesium/cobalt efflux protein [Legionella taurinensis]PUT41020.1 magnesium/cobalt efflux protein [Legionella taurinensis]PUT43252.1 magnesium/cobalt efflux protein [Legionella taurinensis]PUT46438.1 magnesium/cobalt efflux protein [Legionella taurinensis]
MGQLSLTTLFMLLLLLVILSAFFSGSEIGIMSLNRYRLRHMVKKKHKQAIRVNNLLARPDRLLSIILIGNTVANIIASMLATLVGQRLYGDAGVAIATAILTLVILVFSELAPKTLAALHPQAVAFRSALPLMILQTLLAPFVKTVTWITNTLLRCFGVSIDKAQKELLSSEELRSVVHEAGGLMPTEHRSMLISLLDLEQATVEDIMVPKSDIVGIDVNQSWHELLDQLETAQHTRLPLYRDTIDHLIGVVHVRDLFNLMVEERLDKESLIKAADEPYFIPEATPLNAQILNFQKMKKRSCFVVDEYGDLQGLVTMEDILEEVVGEFTTDIAALSKDIIEQDDGSVIVDASITLRHLKRLLGWQLPALGPRTLSGVIIEHLGYIPPPECCLQIDHYQIEVLKVGDNTIKTVRMIKIPNPA